MEAQKGGTGGGGARVGYRRPLPHGANGGGSDGDGEVLPDIDSGFSTTAKYRSFFFPSGSCFAA
jgi:hypothetical protein